MAIGTKQKKILTGTLGSLLAVTLVAGLCLVPAPVLQKVILATAGMGLGLMLGLFPGRLRKASGKNDLRENNNTGSEISPNVQTSLSDQVVFGSITAAILEDFVHCTGTDFEDNMSRVLSRLGSYTGASRCYLYRMDKSEKSAVLALSWSRPGEEDLPSPQASLPCGEAGFQDWLRRDHLTLTGNLEDAGTPHLARDLGLASHRVLALGAITIQRQGRPLGFLGFDSRDTHPWGSQESNLLRLVADLFVAIWSRLDADQALLQTMENLETSNRAKTDFLANMSHEIRTPMNCILGITDLLIEMEPTERQLSYLNMVHDSGNSLLDLINEILDLSKIEAGQLRLDPVETNIRQLVEETVTLISFQAQGKGLEMICRMDPEIPEILVLDPGRVRQVMTNLLNNASKFTAEGHILLDIRSTVRNDGLIDLCISIQDTGVGIRDDKLEMIFEKFTQAEASTTRNFGGTGLGLSISQQLVSLMDGQITATSRIGEGSSFSFTIPVKPVGAPSAINVPNEVRGVLVVTGFESTGSTLGEMLRVLNIPGRIVSTWDQAMRLINDQTEDRTRQWSHVLLDASVCPKHEPDVSRHLAQIPRGLRPQVLLWTSMVNLYLDSDLSSRGFSGTLTKPVFLGKLADALAGRIDEVQETSVSQRSPSGLSTPLSCSLISLEENQTAEEGPHPEGPALRVLVVEDNTFNQRVAKGMIQLQGIGVEIANNGVEALEFLEKADFDLIFMDCQMPVMDGLEATRLIRLLPGHKGQIPIVAMTANVLRRDLEACLEAGMNDTMTKPITRKILRETFARWIPLYSSV